MPFLGGSCKRTKTIGRGYGGAMERSEVAFILFPNNLFKDLSALAGSKAVFLVEELLFFRQFNFHKQKLVFHRASMKAYETYLNAQGMATHYVEAFADQADIRLLIPYLKEKGFTKICLYQPTDDWLEKRITKSCLQTGMACAFINNLLFINSIEDLSAFQDRRKTYFQADFYIHQRKSRRILVDSDLNPEQGRWSFDADNRRKYPLKKIPPKLNRSCHTAYHTEAAEYITHHFSSNVGVIDPAHYYPATHDQAELALADFLENRFSEFGVYEDAIVKEAFHLNHSVLSPLINTGLLLPMEVIHKAIKYAAAYSIPYNSLEGFVRQVLGWREFVRMVYVREGSRQRTRNFWQFNRKIPAGFYHGNTGIEPIDATIQKLIRSGYTHHIERLMVLSNFMLLCEFDPDEVYRWFMEMYVDAYDWVMVPNVYGMGQFADGGLMCTKPYISGSNYILKMSDYKKGGEWTEIWDALFWRFMHVHRAFFMQNPRMGMLLNTFDKWDPSRRHGVLEKAQAFLDELDKGK